MFDIISNPPKPLKLNEKLFEKNIPFINVFSFQKECISTGKLTKKDEVKTILSFFLGEEKNLPERENEKMSEVRNSEIEFEERISEGENIPLIIRRTGGGAVLHRPYEDICFAFTIIFQREETKNKKLAKEPVSERGPENNTIEKARKKKSVPSIKEVFINVSGKISEFLIREIQVLNLPKPKNIKIEENGDIIFDGVKVCGIAMARQKNSFLVEGAIILTDFLKKKKGGGKEEEKENNYDENKFPVPKKNDRFEKLLCFRNMKVSQNTSFDSEKFKIFAFDLFQFLQKEVSKLNQTL